MSTGLADIHRHLDGAVRPATLEELARAQGRRAPPQLRRNTTMPLPDFLERLGPILQLIQRPEDVRRVADEACQDAAAEGVTRLELRIAPQLHRGGSPAEVLDAALAGVAGRAGLVVCGLMGEPPQVLAELVELAATRPGVVGIDLAGLPLPEHRWILEDHAPAFQRAKELGLGRTVHAEMLSPDELLVAVERLGVQRLAQPTVLLEDADTKSRVRRAKVVIEVCFQASLAVGLYPRAEEHALPLLLREGFPVALGTDWPKVLGSTLDEELRKIRKLRGIGPREQTALVETGHAAAFTRSLSPPTPTT